jgi:hypothetical protein
LLSGADEQTYEYMLIERQQQYTKRETNLMRKGGDGNDHMRVLDNQRRNCLITKDTANFIGNTVREFAYATAGDVRQ